MFKTLNGYENIDSNMFFEIKKKSKITRGHNFNLVKKQSRLDVRKFSVSQRTINVWNTLSAECVHASSVNMFKNRIDKYLVKAGSSFIIRQPLCPVVGRRPQHVVSKLPCIVLSSAISCRSSICPGRLSTAWLVSLVVFSCHMVSKR